MEGPTQKKTPTAVDQDVKSDSNSRDPSISSQPKNGVPRPTSFFAQPGTLAGNDSVIHSNSVSFSRKIISTFEFIGRFISNEEICFNALLKNS